MVQGLRAGGFASCCSLLGRSSASGPQAAANQVARLSSDARRIVGLFETGPSLRLNLGTSPLHGALAARLRWGLWRIFHGMPEKRRWDERFGAHLARVRPEKSAKGGLLRLESNREVSSPSVLRHVVGAHASVALRTRMIADQRNASSFLVPRYGTPRQGSRRDAVI